MSNKSKSEISKIESIKGTTMMTDKKCSLCGSCRVTKPDGGFGACSFIDCLDPLFDCRTERAAAPLSAPETVREVAKKAGVTLAQHPVRKNYPDVAEVASSPSPTQSDEEFVLPEISHITLTAVVRSPRYDAIHKQLARELLRAEVASSPTHFTDDQIRRNDLPDDVFGILHDLCYSFTGMQEFKLLNMIERARVALRAETNPGESSGPFHFKRLTAKREWVKATPETQGWWWHWDGLEDSAPFIHHVMVSKTGPVRHFMAYPDSRWCDEVGGWWMKIQVPSPPQENRDE